MGGRPRWTVDLEAGAWPSDAVGGKADGLHRLARAGFRIPPGFCVTARAFERVVAGCVDEADTLDKLQEALRRATVPEELERQIRRRVDDIGARRWAVRSSALEEDTETTSFAGQQRTELNVRGADAVIDAIRRVWAGLYDVDSLLYRARLRVDTVPRPMAVVVQAMVDVREGGVMFTRDPVAAEPAETVLISASSESAEAVVEGSSGDNYWVERGTGAIDRFVPAGERSEAVRHSRDAVEAGVLNAAQIRELVEAAGRLEEVFGGPRDVEWAWGTVTSDRAAELYFLQSRPITDRRESSRPISGTPQVWTNVNVGEALPGVATPLTWSIIGKFSRRGFARAFGTLGLSVPEDYDLVGSFRGRVYLNLTQFVSIARSVPILEPEVLQEMAGGGGMDLVADVSPAFPATKFFAHLPVTVARVLGAQLLMPLVAPRWSAYFESAVDAFHARDLEGLGRGALAAELGEIDRLFDWNGLITLTCSSNFLMSYVVMKTYLELFGGPAVRGRERDLVAALDVQSAEPGMDILALSRLASRSERIRETLENWPSEEVVERLREQARRGGDGLVGRFLGLLESFLDEHGHRAPREAELATPRWREDSRFVIDIIEGHLAADDLPSARAYRSRWRRQRRELQTLVDEGFNALTRPPFRLLLAWARMTARIREYMRSHVVESLDLYRQFALECGRRLRDGGVLGAVEDVFYLRYEELKNWLEGAGSVDRFAERVLVRRALVEALRELADPPNTFVLQDGEIIDEQEFGRRERSEHDEGAQPGRVRATLEGLSGSRGRVTGRARVIEDPESGQTVQSGEILVAPYTDVGWTPLFLTASAVVMGLGGPLSHACIVAREFGIPTVVNARGACETIATGDLITVDADEGVVYVHEDEADAED